MSGHIRDLMESTVDFDRVSNKAMCGDSGDKLTFCIPWASDCSRCKERWYEEEKREPVKHGFRLKMHGLLNGGRAL